MKTAALFALFAIVGLAAAVPMEYYGYLNGLQNGNQVGEIGTGWVTVDTETNMLNTMIWWAPALTGVTAAHIHGPAAFGSTASPIVFFTVDTANNKANFTGPIPAAFNVTALSMGLYYFNVHTTANPGGAIRGQIYTTTNSFSANMDSAQANTASTGVGKGMCVITDAAAGSVNCFVNFYDITDATNCHIHGPAFPGSNAGILFTLTRGTGDMINTYSFAGTFTQQQILYLRTGMLYFALHTTAIPAGAIRGELLMSAVNNGLYNGLFTSGCYPDNGAYTKGCINYVAGNGMVMDASYTDAACTMQTDTILAPQLLWASIMQNFMRGGWDATISSIRTSMTFAYVGPNAATDAANIAQACSSAVLSNGNKTVMFPRSSCPDFPGFATQYGNVKTNADLSTIMFTQLDSNINNALADFTVHATYNRNSMYATCADFFAGNPIPSSSTGGNNNGNSASASAPAFALVAALVAAVRLF